MIIRIDRFPKLIRKAVDPYHQQPVPRVRLNVLLLALNLIGSLVLIGLLLLDIVRYLIPLPCDPLMYRCVPEAVTPLLNGLNVASAAQYRVWTSIAFFVMAALLIQVVFHAIYVGVLAWQAFGLRLGGDVSRPDSDDTLEPTRLVEIPLPEPYAQRMRDQSADQSLADGNWMVGDDGELVMKPKNEP
ncbi:MAG: hypothetical protein H7Y11_05885 [Armatimonadetes bacterium]|nr:hypothetical protein [Anaerolineae bacterium]